LAGNSTYSGSTIINAGTLQIGNGGTSGALSASSTITNNGTLVFNRSNTVAQGTNFSTAAITGTGSIIQNGSGNLTLNAANTYSGGTTLNTGTLVIGNAAAAGTGTITQTDGTSLLKIDTTGTITNAMLVYNVFATQSATFSGAITVNNATWDIDTGDTLTISGVVSGNGGVTKTGNGTLILSGSNSYNGSTVINAGTLEAASVNALGANNTVQVNGGTLLVSTDNAINGRQITLNGTSTTVATLAFSGNYSGRVDNLTLSKNSIIDLGDGSVSIMFDTFVMSTYMLDIYNWTGTTLWGGGTGNDTDKVYFGPDLSDEALAKIRFHSGAVGVGDSFLGSGFELMPQTNFDGGLGYQIIPVPEPETYATGILLVLGGAVWLWRKRSVFTTQNTEEG
jgi:fibronectin-binding autotransporter adhesin